VALARILVATDFSHHSDVATRLAAAIAATGGAELLLVHVDSMEAGAPFGVPPRAWEAHRRDRLAQLQAGIDRAADALRRRDLAVTGVVRAGEIPDQVRDAAREWAADLIVMGSQGADAGRQILFGSNAAWVSRIAPCPVLVTRRDQANRLPPSGRFAKPLVGIDYSRFSEPLVRVAADFADAAATLELLHVMRPLGLDLDDVRVESFDLDEATEAERRRQLERLQAFARDAAPPGRAVSVAVDVGRPAPALMAAAERDGNDVIVVGAHSRETEVELLVGTVAERVLRHATLPILLLPATALQG
jgi:nucleotide-binding universal stress UspA family protein